MRRSSSRAQGAGSITPGTITGVMLADGTVTDSKISIASADGKWVLAALAPSAAQASGSLANAATYTATGPAMSTNNRRERYLWVIDVVGTEYQFTIEAIYRRDGSGVVTKTIEYLGQAPGDSWPSGVWAGTVSCSVSGSTPQCDVLNSTGGTLTSGVVVRYQRWTEDTTP